MLRYVSWLLAAAVIVGGPAQAADTAVKADRVVDAILQRESTGVVDHRADDLGDAMEHSDRARWAAGYVQSPNVWQRFDISVPFDDRLREYEQRRSGKPLTARQHLELADWCRDQKLPVQERAHLWSAVSMDREQTPLLRRLGFQHVDGEWLSAEDQRQRAVKDRESQRQARKWGAKAKSILVQLSHSSEPVRDAARRMLYSMDDSDAIAILEAELCQSPSATPGTANEFVQFASSCRFVAGTKVLMRQSVLSPWDEVRVAAGDALRARRADHYVPDLLSSVSTPISVRSGSANLSMPRAWGSSKTIGVIEDELIFRREDIHHQYQFVLHQVTPVLQLGRKGILHVIPDFYGGNGLQKLAQFNNERRMVARPSEPALKEMLVLNEAIVQWNERVSQALIRGAGFGPGIDPRELWREWSDKTHTEEATSKPIITADRVEVSEQTQMVFNPANPSCLPAGTMVATVSGLRPIESLQVGDTVLAKNIETGTLSHQPVIRTTVRKPQPLVALHTKVETIRATRGHYFWVSGKGWRMVQEIKPGDRLHGVHGTVSITDVTMSGSESVYNLIVEDANSYFVGRSHVLSHDVTTPIPTDIVVPGLAAR